MDAQEGAKRSSFKTPDFSRAFAVPSLCGPTHALRPRLTPTYSVPSVSATLPAPHGCVKGVIAPNVPHTQGIAPRTFNDFRSEAELLLARAASQPLPILPRLHTGPRFSVENIAVRFKWTGNACRSVFLAGSFNEWGMPIALTRRVTDSADPHGSTWSCVVRLSSGTYRYKYVVDGEWQVDESTAKTHDNTYGVVNVVIVDLEGI